MHFAVRSFLYPGTWHHSDLLSLETIQTLRRAFSLETQPRWNATERERVEKGSDRGRKKEIKKERKKEGMWEKARRFIPLLRNAALQRAQSAIHLWLRDEIVWLRLVSVLNDTQRRCHRDNFGKMKKSILKVNRALPAGGAEQRRWPCFLAKSMLAFSKSSSWGGAQ